jgi:hypothetical protein
MYRHSRIAIPVQSTLNIHLFQAKTVSMCTDCFKIDEKTCIFDTVFIYMFLVFLEVNNIFFTLEEQ